MLDFLLENIGVITFILAQLIYIIKLVRQIRDKDITADEAMNLLINSLKNESSMPNDSLVKEKLIPKVEEISKAIHASKNAEEKVKTAIDDFNSGPIIASYKGRKLRLGSAIAIFRAAKKYF